MICDLKLLRNFLLSINLFLRHIFISLKLSSLPA